jgi:hypothetical protein
LEQKHESWSVMDHRKLFQFKNNKIKKIKFFVENEMYVDVTQQSSNQYQMADIEKIDQLGNMNVVSFLKTFLD